VSGRRMGRWSFAAILWSLVLVALPAAAAAAAEAVSCREILRRVDRRDEGVDMRWDLTMRLVDSRGQAMTRKAILLRKRFETDAGRQDRQVTVFTSPANIRNTGLLTYDYKDADTDDDVWLYLPALKRLRRIPASDRGDNFVGTDFTYEDVKGGFAVEDYECRLLGEEAWSGEDGKVPVWRVEIEPRGDKLVRALGFARSEMLVRQDANLRVYQEFYGKSGELERVMRASRIGRVDGIWTFRVLEAKNHQTGHRTILELDSVRYNLGLDDDHFTERTLIRERLQ
jgi:hypothetical protein